MENIIYMYTEPQYVGEDYAPARVKIIDDIKIAKRELNNGKEFVMVNTYNLKPGKTLKDVQKVLKKYYFDGWYITDIDTINKELYWLVEK